MFRILVYLLIGSLIYQENITLFGNSVVTLVFFLFFIRLFFIDFKWYNFHRSMVLLSITLFICVIVVIELYHPNSNFQNINRIFQTFFGAIILYLNVRSMKEYRLLVNAFLVLATVYSLFIIAYGYENLISAQVDSWQILQNAFGAPRNPNDVGYVVAVGVSILVFRYYFALPQPSLRKFKLAFIILILFISLLIIGKRTGVLLALVAPGLAVLYFKEIRFGKMLTAGALFLGALFYFGDTVVDRASMYFQDSAVDFKEIDGRARLYQASKDNIPNVWLTGVGSGNYYGSWGRATDFYIQKSFGRGAEGRVSGAHNLFFQFIIFWGILGLLLFCKIIFDFIRMLPPRSAYAIGHIEVFTVLACTVAAFFLTHVLATKEFSVAFAVVLVYHFKVMAKK